MPDEVINYFFVSQYLLHLSIITNRYSQFYFALKECFNLFHQDIQNSKNLGENNSDKIILLEQKLEELDKSFLLFFESGELFFADRLRLFLGKEKLDPNTEKKAINPSSAPELFLARTTQLIENLNKVKDSINQASMFKKPTFFQKLQLALLNFCSFIKKNSFCSEIFREAYCYKFREEDLADKWLALEKSVEGLNLSICTQFFKPINQCAPQKMSYSKKDENLSEPLCFRHHAVSCIV